MKTLLRTKKLSKSYSGITVLNSVDFELKEGEVHALVGENGAGKSTFIKIIAGVISPDDGAQIEVMGENVTRLTASRSRSLGISVIFQDISLFPNLSIAENICFGAQRYGVVKWRDIYKQAEETLKKMGISLDVRQPLGEASVGQQQLVAIARAIAFDARVLIMDEPTASLSSGEVESLMSIIRSLKANGVGIIYISHKFEEIFDVADTVSVLRDGNLVCCDAISKFDQQSLINLMVGRELRFIPYHMEGEAGEVLFEVRNLTSEPYFKNVSFQVRKNEVLGITGLVGAGRSEVAQAIFGLLPIASGEILLHGKSLNIKNADQAIREGICYLPEDRREQGLFMKMSVATNITTASMHKMLDKGLISAKKETEIAKTYVERLSIRPDNVEYAISKLSGGNQQKALVARWLNADPKVLIVDEVTSGVDVGVKTEIHRLLREQAANGVAVIMISSDLTEVLAVSDRIMVMRGGRNVGVMDISEATQEKILEKGMLG